jgi:hypothetical protein
MTNRNQDVRSPILAVAASIVLVPQGIGLLGTSDDLTDG